MLVQCYKPVDYFIVFDDSTKLAISAVSGFCEISEIKRQRKCPIHKLANLNGSEIKWVFTVTL